MRWVEREDASWPASVPEDYYADRNHSNPKSPDIGSLNAILVSLVLAIEQIERRLDILERY
jgi:hypothetical protein